MVSEEEIQRKKKVTSKQNHDPNCICKARIWVPSLTSGWTEAQKAQNNEFVESGLENRTLMNQTGTQVDLDDKRM